MIFALIVGTAACASVPVSGLEGRLFKVEQRQKNQGAVNIELYRRLNTLLDKTDRIVESIEGIAPGVYGFEGSIQEFDKRIGKIEDWIAIEGMK
jgi:hypothetical protein